MITVKYRLTHYSTEAYSAQGPNLVKQLRGEGYDIVDYRYSLTHGNMEIDFGNEADALMFKLKCL